MLRNGLSDVAVPLCIVLYCRAFDYTCTCTDTLLFSTPPAPRMSMEVRGMVGRYADQLSPRKISNKTSRHTTPSTNHPQAQRDRCHAERGHKRRHGEDRTIVWFSPQNRILLTGSQLSQESKPVVCNTMSPRLVRLRLLEGRPCRALKKLNQPGPAAGLGQGANDNGMSSRGAVCCAMMRATLVCE